MTSQYLLLWIVGGILLQLAIYLGIGFGQHWQNYLALRKGGADLEEPQPLTATWPGWRNFKLVQRVVEDAEQQICSFYLAPEDGQTLLPYLPGQFLTFRLAIPTAAGGTEPITRCYSLSDAPASQSYRVTIKRAPKGISSNFFHDQLPVGSLLQVRAPAGHFHISQSDAPVVLIAGGIGITPMLSMLEWSLAKQTGRELWLVYGVRHSRELAMLARLQTLAASYSNFHLQLCFSHPLPQDKAGDDFHYRGRIDVDLMRRLLPLNPYHFYICGPTPMLESLVPELQDWGVPEDRIHYEAFGPASINRKNPISPQTGSQNSVKDVLIVTFAQSGKQLPWQDSTGNLLDFAQAHGIPISAGCRAGSCGTCQTSIRSGEVSYRQAPEFDPEPGSCLPCICTPKTPITLDV